MLWEKEFYIYQKDGHTESKGKWLVISNWSIMLLCPFGEIEGISPMSHGLPGSEWMGVAMSY